MHPRSQCTIHNEKVTLRQTGPHRRYNPLLSEWVLTSPARLERPWLGQMESVATVERPQYDPECYLCPENTRAGGVRNPRYTDTFAFDNDFPAIESTTETTFLKRSELLKSQSESGICRVLCFSPRHDLWLARMSETEIASVVNSWISELTDCGKRTDVQYVQIFENHGELMGCSNPHPHCQIWAVGHVPTIPARKIAAQQTYFKQHGSDLLGDYLDVELSEVERIVYTNDDWVALVPFWAVWPYELMVIPKRRVATLTGLNEIERKNLTALIANVTVRYDNLFQCEFPYSMGWHGCPTDGNQHPAVRVHAVYHPPLLRSQTIRKFLVGYELTAEPQRDLTAEMAAEQLRAVSGQHYLISNPNIAADR